MESEPRGGETTQPAPRERYKRLASAAPRNKKRGRLLARTTAQLTDGAAPTSTAEADAPESPDQSHVLWEMTGL